jgi:hypothetical protein
MARQPPVARQEAISHDHPANFIETRQLKGRIKRDWADLTETGHLGGLLSSGEPRLWSRITVYSVAARPV